jgi:hypothetical protein
MEINRTTQNLAPFSSLYKQEHPGNTHKSCVGDLGFWGDSYLPQRKRNSFKNKTTRVRKKT